VWAAGLSELYRPQGATNLISEADSMRATVALARLMRRIAPSSLPSPLKLKVNHQTINYQRKATSLKTPL